MTNALLQRDVPTSDRALAMHGISVVVNDRLQSLLQGEDKAALSGLAENRSLPVDYLIQVRNRLSELGDDIGARSAQQTIDKVIKTRVPEDPEELFGEESRKGKFLEDKIDFMGRRLLSFEREVTKRLKFLLIGIAIAVAVALLVLITK